MDTPTRPVLFHRAGMFYPITAFQNDDWAEHARLNPGTLRVTDALTGEVLWQAPLNDGALAPLAPADDTRGLNQ